MSEVSPEETVRRLSIEYVRLRNLVQILQQRVDLLNQLISNIETTLNSLESIKNLGKDNVVLFPLGGLVYVKSKILSTDKILVNIGAGVVLEKSIDDAIQFLKNKQRELKLELESTLISLRQATARLQEISAALEREYGRG